MEGGDMEFLCVPNAMNEIVKVTKEQMISKINLKRSLDVRPRYKKLKIENKNILLSISD